VFGLHVATLDLRVHSKQVRERAKPVWSSTSIVNSPDPMAAIATDTGMVHSRREFLSRATSETPTRSSSIEQH